MHNFQYLIIGGGIAGTTCAETLRGLDAASSICIVSDEPYNLYSRIAVSKENYLLKKITEEQVILKKDVWYEKNHITLMKGVTATAVDPQKKEVTLANNETIRYEKLLLALGMAPCRWTVPGGNLAGIHYARSLDDGKGILRDLASSINPVMIGGGFIAFELADIAIKLGRTPTVLIREPYFWEMILDEEGGMLVEDHMAGKGVKIIRNKVATEVIPSTTTPAHVGGLRTDDGATIETDFIAACIGTRLCAESFLVPGLSINKGIVADAQLKTNLPDVWTAGDCAEYDDVIIGERTLMGNWANAMMQGKCAAQNMAGKQSEFRLLSSYPTVGFGLSICFIGNVRKLPERETITRGSRAQKTQTRLLINKNNRIVGATLLNANADIPWIAKLAADQRDISGIIEKLADPAVSLKELATSK